MTELRSPAADRLKRQRTRYKEVKRLLQQADPIGSTAGGPTSDVVEINVVIHRMTRAESTPHVQEILHEAFSEWLGEFAGPRECYAALAINIWAALNRDGK